MTSRINPHINNSKPMINKKPATINVGNLGTNPVAKYSLKTGTNKQIEMIKKIKANSPKNAIGLYSLNNLAIVPSTFAPSDYVLSFDSLPSGRSR